MAKLLEVKNLRTYFYTEEGVVRAVDGVSWDLEEGETLGLVGESGSGKSVTAMSILRLIPRPPGRIVEGEIIFEGQDLLEVSDAEIRSIRGNRIAMVFQEPMTSLNPVLDIGNQLMEAIQLHMGLDKGDAEKRAIELLELVGIPEAAGRVHDYPHQFSGGMRQRVMIAMALSCNPKLLIADEPTTALDVTIQAQILELIQEIQARTGTALLLITHDLAVVAETVESIAVMYAGRIVETGTVEEVLLSPKHPYTQGLLNSIPSERKRGRELTTIEGVVPNPFRMPSGCKFQPRCPYQWDRCLEEPELVQVGGRDRFSRCWLHTPGQADRRQAFETAVTRTVIDVVG